LTNPNPVVISEEMKRSEKVEVGEWKEDKKGGVGRGFVDGAEEGAVIIIIRLFSL